MESQQQQETIEVFQMQRTISAPLKDKAEQQKLADALKSQEAIEFNFLENKSNEVSDAADKQNITKTVASNSQPFSSTKQKIGWYFLMIHGLVGNWFVGQILSLYSQMIDHIENKFEWSGGTKTLYVSLLNALPFMGAIFGSLIVGKLKTTYGRRSILIFSDILLLICTVLSNIVSTPLFLIARLGQGLAFGGYITTNSKYVLEFCPKEYKSFIGQAAIIYIRAAVYFCYVVGFGLPDEEDTDNNYWRYSISILAVFAFLHLFFFFTVFKHETPLFVYMTSRDEEKTLKILKDTFSSERALEELKVLKKQYQKQDTSFKGVQLKDLFTSNYRLRLAIGIVMSIVFHSCGLNTVNVYSTKIFEDLGNSDNKAKMLSTISAAPDIIGIFFGAYIIQRKGRRSIFLWSLILLAANNLLFAFFGWIGMEDGQIPWLMLFRFCWGFGFGSVYFVYVAEILPLVGVVLCSVVYNFSSFAVLFSFPYMRKADFIEATNSFFVYAITLIVAFPFLYKYMKETKGKTKLQIEEMFGVNVSKGEIKRENSYYLTSKYHAMSGI